MKKSIVLLVAMLSLFTTSTVLGQPSNLNTKVKSDCVADAEQIRQLVYNRDILLAQRDNFQERIRILEMAIVGYKNLVTAREGENEALRQQMALDSSTIKTYKDDVETYNKKIAAYEKEIKDITDASNAALKKQKRKTTWSQVTGTLVALGLGWLLITK